MKTDIQLIKARKIDHKYISKFLQNKLPENKYAIYSSPGIKLIFANTGNLFSLNLKIYLASIFLEDCES